MQAPQGKVDVDIRIFYKRVMSSGSRSARGRTIVPVALSAETEARLQETARSLGLSQEQTLLLGLRRGLERLGRGPAVRPQSPSSKA